MTEAVPDDFNVWNAPYGSYGYIEIDAVQQDERSAGRRNVSVGFNFITRKILMSKYRSDFSFAVSEVQFFNQNCECATFSLHDCMTVT